MMIGDRYCCICIHIYKIGVELLLCKSHVLKILVLETDRLSGIKYNFKLTFFYKVTMNICSI